MLRRLDNLCRSEYVGQLSPKGLGHYMVNVSAISPNSLPGLPGGRRMPAAAATPIHGEQAGPGPATPATLFVDSFPRACTSVEWVWRSSCHAILMPSPAAIGFRIRSVMFLIMW